MPFPGPKVGIWLLDRREHATALAWSAPLGPRGPSLLAIGLGDAAAAAGGGGASSGGGGGGDHAAATTRGGGVVLLAVPDLSQGGGAAPGGGLRLTQVKESSEDRGRGQLVEAVG